MNGRLPAANEGQGGALHERTAVAAQPRVRCGTTSWAAPPVGAVELSRRRVTTTAGHGRVARTGGAALGKHGTHREHGSIVRRTAAPHRRGTRTKYPSTAAARQRRTAGPPQACGGASVPSGSSVPLSASVGAAPSTVRLSQLRRRTMTSCDRLATQCLCAAATPTNTDRSSVWLRGSAAQHRDAWA